MSDWRPNMLVVQDAMLEESYKWGIAVLVLTWDWFHRCSRNRIITIKIKDFLAVALSLAGLEKRGSWRQGCFESHARSTVRSFRERLKLCRAVRAPIRTTLEILILMNRLSDVSYKPFDFSSCATAFAAIVGAAAWAVSRFMISREEGAHGKDTRKLKVKHDKFSDEQKSKQRSVACYLSRAQLEWEI